MELPSAVSTVLETDLAAYEPVTCVAEGDRHETVVVADDTGTRYILKVYADSGPEMRHEAPVVASVQEFAFAPSLHQSGVAGSSPYILFERVENTERWGVPEWESTLARTLGETLSQVHTAVEPAADWGQPSETSPSPERLAPSVLSDTVRELQQTPRPHLAGVLPAVVDTLTETVPRRGVIHGDVTVDNVRFVAETETVVLVDWETAGRSDVYFDVAKAELWLFQLFEPLLSTATKVLVSTFREAYGISSPAIERVRALKILLLCRMAVRVERLGPYKSWQHRVDGSCLDQILTVLRRTARTASFVDDTPESPTGATLSGTATEN